MKSCAAEVCQREIDQWVRHAGCLTEVGSAEEFWWQVFNGLLDRMCPTKNRRRAR